MSSSAMNQFVARRLMETMTREEKVGQVIMGDLDFSQIQLDLTSYPLGRNFKQRQCSHPEETGGLTSEEWKSLAQEICGEYQQHRGGAEPHLWLWGYRRTFIATAMSAGAQLSFPHNVGVWEQQIIQICWKQDRCTSVAERGLLQQAYVGLLPLQLHCPARLQMGRTYEGIQ